MVDAAVVGGNIRDLRKSHGLNISELSIQLDVRYEYLSRVELGKQIPSVKLLVEIANFFCVKVTDIILPKTPLMATSATQTQRIIYSLIATNSISPSEFNYLYSVAFRVKESTSAI